MTKGRFGYEILSNYPHLSGADTEIWEKFIQKYPGFFSSVDYDVCVGDFRGADIELEPEWAKNREYLGKYKIDVVGYNSEGIFIIEIKPKAAGKALGQIIMYDFLFARDFKPEETTTTTIITDEIMPNMQELCTEHGILLLKV